MKIKLTTAFLLFSILAFYSCDSYLDVNHDPNVIETVPDAKVLLPAAEVSLANQLMGWDLGFSGGYWSQYWTQSYTGSQFKYLCEYNETSFGPTYQDLTAGVLNDLERIKRLTKDNNNKGTYFAAELLSIFTMQIITDLWGDIPYSEALKGDKGIKNPKFDSGKFIYEDLMKRINELLKIDISSSSIDSKYDFFYAGDLNKWKLFANSLKLKLMVRLSETDYFSAPKTLSFIKSTSFIKDNASIKSAVFDDKKEGKRHPMREFQEGGANYLTTNVIACKNFIDYLIKNSDPRLNTIFSAPKEGHQGAFFGDFDNKKDSNSNGVTDDKEKYSTPLFSEKNDLIVMSTWEVYFYIAEIYARNSDNSNAKKFYDLAIKSSLSQHGITDNSIIKGYAKWKNGSKEEAIKQIAIQKWIANANYQHIESFIERNRTKYPALDNIDIKSDREKAFRDLIPGMLTVSVAGRAKTNGSLPAAPTYPESILTRNTNAPAQKPNLLQKIWWDKKVGK